MKIGIVTFYRAPNYGAMLQANSLRRFLEAMGHDVVFVSYPRVAASRLPLWRVFASRHLQGLKTKLKNYVRYPMTAFAATFPQTKRSRTMDELRQATADCDAFIVGSDQMWNPMWCSGAELSFVMLDFADVGKPRIAYAPSFATTEWREDQNAKLAGELLRKFTRISVREESGVRLATTLSGRGDVVQMIDPTLLHSADFYRKIIAEAGGAVPHYEKSMIFKYMLDEWDDAESSDKAFALVKSKLNLQMIDSDCIPVRGLLAPFCKALGVKTKVSVSEWLAKIAASDFVFTNSFHGTVFAVLFHRPFISILLRGRMNGMNERALSLLKMLGLESRAVYPDDTAAIGAALVSPIDWEKVDAARVVYAERSRNFLHDCLEPFTFDIIRNAE